MHPTTHTTNPIGARMHAPTLPLTSSSVKTMEYLDFSFQGWPASVSSMSEAW